jgi:hypothetical protein
MMLDLHQRFRVSVDFLCIYISEAHPINEWLLYSEVCFRQPRTLEERIAIARKLISETGMDERLVTVDVMDDNAEIAFAAWPERLFIIQNGRIVYKGGTGPFHYHPEEVEQWIAAFLAST